MADNLVFIEGLVEVVSYLTTDLASVLKPVAIGTAKALEDIISPYPDQLTPIDPDRYYERGYGPRWIRKDGSTGGKKTSERLNTRWAVRPYGALGAALLNLASYAPFVHALDEQAGIHADAGWVTDDEAIAEIEAAGTVETLLNAAIAHTFNLTP